MPGVDYFSLRSAGARWHLHQISPDDRRFGYVRMRRQNYRNSVFLDTRIDRPDSQVLQVKAPKVAPAKRRLPVHFIFHSAFCGSTLLSRAFESDAQTLVLREPLALLQLAETRRLHADRWHGRRFKQLVDVVLSSLSVAFDGQTRVVIKPSNLVCGLTPELMSDSRSRATLMFQGLRSFLVSCAKKNADTQLRLLDLPARLCGYFGMPLVPADQLAFEQARSDYLRAGALAWLLHMRQFNQLLQSRWSPRLLPLDFDDWLDQPRRHADQLAARLGIRLGEPHWLTTHAKQPGTHYGADQRQRETDTVIRMLGGALPRAIDWLDRSFPGEPAELHSRLRSAAADALAGPSKVAV
ncbi:MAG: hypothetical protein DHS20C11_33430 [Lysobacteraceae bacterium]|nr:MAG: hypothetical protein DHS20C11_33430 [Xanthomonadaceae bacterium]